MFYMLLGLQLLFIIIYYLILDILQTNYFKTPITEIQIDLFEILKGVVQCIQYYQHQS